MDCLREAGWTIVSEESDGYVVKVPPEQDAAFSADSKRCQEGAAAGRPAPEVTAADYRRLHAHFVITADCLAKEGFPQGAGIPSEQKFVTDAVREKGAIWNPWDVIGPASYSPELEQKCPQMPPDW